MRDTEKKLPKNKTERFLSDVRRRRDVFPPRPATWPPYLALDMFAIMERIRQWG